MPYLSTSQEWLQQSSLLLAARPSTARVTTKYSVQHGDGKGRKRKAGKSVSATTDVPESDDTSKAAKEPKGTLILKTYDPVSGICLKYQTTKGAEVGRLIGGLKRLGRTMAALPEVTEDVSMANAPPAKAEPAQSSDPPDAATGDAKGKVVEQKSAQTSSGGGAKKKKKGKR